MYIPEILLAILIIIEVICLPRLIARAGRPVSFLAWIPVLHFIPWLKLIKRPWWWFILLLIPGVNVIMMMILNVELGIAFNKRKTKDQWFFALLPWVAIPQLAFKEVNQAFAGPRDWTNIKKSAGREWGEAIVFAIVAATVIRTFFIEAFTIPTPSMEKSMLVGDYLFVSKMSYGPKIPQTPMSVPFVHNTLPGTMINSYVDWFSLPYYRLPGFGSVERFDPVVFNFPNGDTIVVDPYYAGHDYYAILRQEAITLAKSYAVYLQNPSMYNAMARENLGVKMQCASCGLQKGMRKPFPVGGLRARPMDKKENYIKRCIGLPGENLKIVDRQVYINDQVIENPEEMMWNYYISFKNAADIEKIMVDYRLFQYAGPKGLEPVARDSTGMFVYEVPLTVSEADELKSRGDIIVHEVSNDSLVTDNMMEMYPNSPMAPFNTWTRDNYGPIHIPAAGETIQLTPENIATYRRVIDVYEENEWREEGGKVYINGAEATSYTFKYNYYWMMGDNRHHSADSRYWGFVPETHVVGKAVFTWMSRETGDPTGETNGFRFDRIFRMVK